MCVSGNSLLSARLDDDDDDDDDDWYFRHSLQYFGIKRKNLAIFNKLKVLGYIRFRLHTYKIGQNPRVSLLPDPTLGTSAKQLRNLMVVY